MSKPDLYCFDYIGAFHATVEAARAYISDPFRFLGAKLRAIECCGLDWKSTVCTDDGKCFQIGHSTDRTWRTRLAHLSG